VPRQRQAVLPSVAVRRLHDLGQDVPTWLRVALTSAGQFQSESCRQGIWLIDPGLFTGGSYFKPQLVDTHLTEVEQSRTGIIEQHQSQAPDQQHFQDRIGSLPYQNSSVYCAKKPR
jgi:hypothetical protein